MMEEKLYMIMDDTNDCSFEDLEKFEATLDPAIRAEHDAKVAAIVESIFG